MTQDIHLLSQVWDSLWEAQPAGDSNNTFVKDEYFGVTTINEYIASMLSVGQRNVQAILAILATWQLMTQTYLSVSYLISSK